MSFAIGLPREELVNLVRSAAIGLHTMRLEHFGIAVVEMMAARVVPVAHRSGGPLLDIVGADGDRGFVAETAEDYADAITILVRDSTLRNGLADAARAFVRYRYSDAAFAAAFVTALAPALGVKSLRT